MTTKRFLFHFITLSFILILPLTTFSQSESGIPTKSDSPNCGNWSIGFKFNPLYSYLFQGVIARRTITHRDDIGASFLFNGALQKRKSWHRVNDGGEFAQDESQTYSGSQLKIGVDWRHFENTDSQIRSYWKISLIGEMHGFIDSENSVDFEIGPAYALGWQWKPNPQIAVFAEFGAYVNYGYDRNNNYNTRSDGSRYLSSRYVNYSFDYGFDSSFGLSYTI